MSKDKPEAGDVWEWNGNRIFITCVLGDEKIGAISFMNNYDRHHCTDSFDSFDKKIRYGVMKYIGPSKVDINNLFETAAEAEEENKQLKDLLYSIKCCLTSENIEPKIRIEKALPKINEALK